MSSRFHMRSLIKSKHKQLSKNIKEKKFYRMKNNKYLDYSFTESNVSNHIQSINIPIKNENEALIINPIPNRRLDL